MSKHRVPSSLAEPRNSLATKMARLMTAPGDQLLYSRSGFDLIQLCRDNPELAIRLSEERPLLSHVIGADAGPDLVAVALDAERRSLIKVDAVRIASYEKASAKWRGVWPNLRGQIEGLPLHESHAIVREEAENSSLGIQQRSPYRRRMK